MKKTLFRGLLGAALTILVCLPAASRGKGPKKTCEFTDADFRTEKILEALPIRATFLDEVSWDIPHQNWGVKEWDADFKAMKQMGINTVVLIRAGLGSWIAAPFDCLLRTGKVKYPPVIGKYKVYIIDEVHMLSTSAFNALLKTLEEPPSYVIFILATTEVHKIPITILSRCQHYDFKRISIETITDRMRDLMQTEQVEVEEKALRYIAKAADGSMRDALSLLDQCIAFYLGQKLTYDHVLDVLGAVDTEVFSRLLRFVMDRNVLGCIELLEEIVMQGRELVQFVTDFTWYLRNLMLVQTADNLEDVIDMSTDNLANLKEEASMLSMDQIIRYIHIFSELSGQIRYAAQKRILVEIALIKLCKPEMETDQEAVLDRIRQVEEKVENGIVVTAAQMPAGAPGAQGVPQAGVAKPKPQLPKAVPGDIQEIVRKWPAIVGNAENPMKMYLKNARLSLGGDNKLMVVLEDGLASDYFKGEAHEQNKQQLEMLLSDFSSKEIEVTIQTVESSREFEDNYVDLSKVINMEIDEEE